MRIGTFLHCEDVAFFFPCIIDWEFDILFYIYIIIERKGNEFEILPQERATSCTLLLAIALDYTRKRRTFLWPFESAISSCVYYLYVKHCFLPSFILPSTTSTSCGFSNFLVRLYVSNRTARFFSLSFMIKMIFKLICMSI